MMPCTQSTLSCCTSFWKRSIVSLGEVSSSTTSSILRPAMPPLALNFSTAHSVAFMPLMPGLAAIPVRGARMPILQGLAWAMAGANTVPEVAAAPVAAMDLSTVRRESFMGRFLGGLRLRRLGRR